MHTWFRSKLSSPDKPWLGTANTTNPLATLPLRPPLPLPMLYCTLVRVTFQLVAAVGYSLPGVGRWVGERVRRGIMIGKTRGVRRGRKGSERGS